MPVPAPAPITGMPSVMYCFSLFSIDLVFCNVSVSTQNRNQSIRHPSVMKHDKDKATKRM